MFCESVNGKCQIKVILAINTDIERTELCFLSDQMGNVR
jgi:hypothetical protein